MKLEFPNKAKISGFLLSIASIAFPKKIFAQQLLYGVSPSPRPSGFILGAVFMLAIPFVLIVVFILGIIYFFKRFRKNAPKNPQNRRA